MKQNQENGVLFLSTDINLSMEKILETYSQKMIEKLCPSINDEIAGFAEALNINHSDIVFLSQSYQYKGACSHFFIPPEYTEKTKAIVGRIYEFGYKMDDLRLCTTKVKNCHSHIGFSCLLCGRLDGFDEHGLAVTMSASGLSVCSAPGMKGPVNIGFQSEQFWTNVKPLIQRLT